MFSTSLYAEWEFVSESIFGDKFYVDITNIREVDGSIYFWRLLNYNENYTDAKSSKVYLEGDCKKFGMKRLNQIYYSKQNGDGDVLQIITEPSNNFQYPAPESSDHNILKFVCNFVFKK